MFNRDESRSGGRNRENDQIVKCLHQKEGMSDLILNILLRETLTHK